MSKLILLKFFVHGVKERIEKWKDRKDLVFSYMYLVGRVEKWRDGKLFYLVEKKSERIENKVCIKLPLYPVGPKGSKGFSPFHFKPKVHAEEEEVPEDE